MKKYTYLLLFAVLLYGCKKECTKKYTFLFPTTITPSSSTVHVGDTLWFESNVPEYILDVTSGGHFRFDSASVSSDFQKFRATVDIYRIDTALLVSSLGDFRYILSKGDVSIYNSQAINTSSLSMKYAPLTKGYSSIKFAFIPQKKGSYIIDLSQYGLQDDYLHHYVEPVNFDDKCEEYIDAVKYWINNKGVHYELLKDSPNLSLKERSQLSIEQRSYCFVVLP